MGKELYTIIDNDDGCEKLDGGETAVLQSYTEDQIAQFGAVMSGWRMKIEDSCWYDHEDYGERHEYSERKDDILQEKYLIYDGSVVGCIVAVDNGKKAAVYLNSDNKPAVKKHYYCKGISRLETGYGTLTFSLVKVEAE